MGNHNILIGGTKKEIIEGKTLINSTVYKISKGTTIINGTNYDIKWPALYIYNEGTISPWTTWYNGGASGSPGSSSWGVTVNYSYDNHTCLRLYTTNGRTHYMSSTATVDITKYNKLKVLWYQASGSSMDSMGAHIDIATSLTAYPSNGTFTAVTYYSNPSGNTLTNINGQQKYRGASWSTWEYDVSAFTGSVYILVGLDENTTQKPSGSVMVAQLWLER